jgi:hypothetical protein
MMSYVILELADLSDNAKLKGKILAPKNPSARKPRGNHCHKKQREAFFGFPYSRTWCERVVFAYCVACVGLGPGPGLRKVVRQRACCPVPPFVRKLLSGCLMMADSVAIPFSREYSSRFTLRSCAFACQPSQRQGGPRACVV